MKLSFYLAAALLAASPVVTAIAVLVPLRRHLRRLAAAVRRMAGGDLATPIVGAGAGTVGELATACETLRLRFTNQLSVLQRDANELEDQLVALERVRRADAATRARRSPIR